MKEYEEKGIDAVSDTLVRLNLASEEAVAIKEVDGKKVAIAERTPDGQPIYVRNDIISLQNLLMKFDTRKHPLKEWNIWAVVKEKIYHCYSEQTVVAVLTYQEASWLKGFLEDLPANEGANVSLRDNDVRTRQDILDQLYAVALKKSA